MTKPLFIPLKAEYFDAFVAGVKNTEYRPYGPRWNERVCAVGRRVILSRGYGIRRRSWGYIGVFLSLPLSAIPDEAAAAYRKCYGANAPTQVACVQIGLDVWLQGHIDRMWEKERELLRREESQ
jgi:hypothetical protein